MDETYNKATAGLLVHEDLIRASHQHCANMRKSRSISSSCLPVRRRDDIGDGDIKYFPISVCCTSDYCLMSNPMDNDFSYNCTTDNECFLLKKDLIVQAMPSGTETIDECIERYSDENGENKDLQFTNGGLYYAFASEKLRESICQG
jgi:hypothetical protein